MAETGEPAAMAGESVAVAADRGLGTTMGGLLGEGELGAMAGESAIVAADSAAGAADRGLGRLATKELHWQ